MGAKPKNADHEAFADDMLFEDQYEHYKGLAAGFCQKFIENTPRDSHMAHYICANAEEGFVGHFDLMDKFPKRKRDHEQRTKQAKKLRSPMESEKRDLQKQIRLLKKTHGGEKGELAPGSEAAGMAEGFYRQIAELDERLSKVKLPRAFSGQYKLDEERDRTGLVKKEDWDYLQDWFGQREKKFSSKTKDKLFENLNQLADYMGLGEKEKRLLVLAVTFEKVHNFKQFIRQFSLDKQAGFNAMAAKMIDVEPNEYQAMLQEDSALIANGLLVLPDGRTSMPVISAVLMHVLSKENMTFDSIVNLMIGEPVTTDLDWDRDFTHLGEPGNELIRLLQGAKEERQRGMNFLLYGIQDAGKTEAVKAACKKAGITLYAVGEKKGGQEPTRADRISQALLAQSLLADQPNAAVLFDEMEDALPVSGIMDEGEKSEAAASASKIYLNRMLEKNKTITFWTANNAEKFHPAVRRRMRFSVQFRIPPANVREGMWRSISAKHDFELAAPDASRLARAYMAPPGMITTAIRNANLTKGGVSSIEASLRASATVVFGGRGAIEIRNGLSDNYDLSLLNASVEDRKVDMHQLTEDLTHSPHRDISMLFYGPPGTGKSAYVRHLSNALGMEVLFKRASDLLGMYLGESEQKIAAAFQEAEETNQFLIIDEADSMLRDRRFAEKSWEVSIVNEMLTWMERHPLPFAMTTNLTDNLDQASKRRFAFKMKCDYLKPQQSAKAFEVFFGQEAPQAILRMDQLTPGDFAAVKRQAKFFSAAPTAHDLIAMLEHEVAVKSEEKRMEIGFLWDRVKAPEVKVADRPHANDSSSGQIRGWGSSNDMG